MKKAINTELCELFEFYLSDKCPNIYHSYSPEYYNILNPFRNTIKNVLEIGVGSASIMSNLGNMTNISKSLNKIYKCGASLRAWRDFFINAQIYSIDIDKSVLFEEDRIKCFYADQSNKESLIETIRTINTKLDLIIDDGSHVVGHMILSIQTLFPFLNKNGLYIIEDIRFQDLEIFKNLKLDNCNIKYVHNGTWEWDSFVCYEKM